MVNDTLVYVFSTDRKHVTMSLLINVSSSNLRDCLGKGILSSWDEDCLHCKKNNRRITRGIFKEKAEDLFGRDGRHSAEPDGGREVEKMYAHSGRTAVSLCWLSF